MLTCSFGQISMLSVWEFNIMTISSRHWQTSCHTLLTHNLIYSESEEDGVVPKIASSSYNQSCKMSVPKGRDKTKFIKIELGSQSKVWQYKVLIVRCELSSIFDKGDTELVDNTLPFAGKSRWYNSLMPWKTKAEPWFDGKLIRKIGERITQIQCQQGRHSIL